MLLPDDAPPQGYYTHVLGQAYPTEISVTTDLSALEATTSNELKWVEHTVAGGETLSTIFDQMDLGYSNLLNMLASDENAKFLEHNLRPNKTLLFGLDKDGQLAQLKYDGKMLGGSKYQSDDVITITRTGRSTYTSNIDRPEYEYTVNFYEGTVVEGGMFFLGAGYAAGLNKSQLDEISDKAFAWDIDFAKDIQIGDSFRVLVQEKWSDGEFKGLGEVLAIEFDNYGTTLTAIKAENGGFYDEKGRAMQKAFLRAPLDFRRVSSNFNPRRLHPVTGQVRPHRGTDYVAPVGTDIWSVGSGIVYKSAYNQYNGNYVFIRHNDTYVTKYLHLSKRLVSQGDRVEQGDVIGRLGGTGRVTGPHLHYEFVVNGVHQNPRTVDLPKAISLEDEDLTNYLKLAKERVAQLQAFDKLHEDEDNSGSLVNSALPM
uniref:peptidoglycan DD-metalloendopeptidase family protein n=1 Tax=Thaumasiovibrio occultus TaxID=1891184 RepID=UPI000B361712|nr:peptidoglycan DD-metalloendopeptidase family protein [Thaumasiovibrio occultus]